MISVVCPFHNESAVISRFFEACEPVLSRIDVEYEYICVNDGSTDATLSTLLAEQSRNQRISIIDFSRQFGKEAALSAGLKHAKGDAVIPIDADLQDPPELIPLMVEKWREGFEVVRARRNSRPGDGVFKRLSASAFYKLHNRISQIDIPENVGDFRLMDRAVVDTLNALPENQRFMKGLFAWAGFSVVDIPYERTERVAGSSKFNGWKLWNFALEGITSFSTAPLRIWTYIGMLVAAVALIYSAIIVSNVFIYGIDVPGYASLLCVVLFMGSLNMIGLGILGEYIGRTYMEVKNRPLYVIRKIYQDPS